ncbi:MAG: hypothetical protein AAFO07_04415 [Bacteroidota bacterium]
MKLNLKKTIFSATLLFGLLFSTSAIAQTSCCTKSKSETAEKIACTTSEKESTSGCTPSACRGAKTKFGEAKVISELRGSLIALKADMEKSTSPAFDAKAYDIHGIVGETDDESLEIIIQHVKTIESDFATKLSFKPTTFSLPQNKAKQVQYLNSRIDALKKKLL